MNRELVCPSGAGVYPLTGDVLSQAGSAVVTTVGIQGRTVANPFLDGGEVLEYNQATNQWVPTLRACITVDGVVASLDYEITIDVPYQVTIDGTGVA